MDGEAIRTYIGQTYELLDTGSCLIVEEFVPRRGLVIGVAPLQFNFLNSMITYSHSDFSWSLRIP